MIDRRASEDAGTLIDRMGLMPHPEGGWYRETSRSDHATAILFLLEGGGR